MLEPLNFVRDEVCASQVSLLQLSLLPRLQWTYLVVKRKWGYAGHCLRRDPDKAEVLLVQVQNPGSITQAVPAPWHSLYTFLADTVRQLGWWAQDSKPEIWEAWPLIEGAGLRLRMM